MRFPRLALALALVATPLTTVAITATSVSAAPLSYTAISVATRGACALSTDGIVVCWGDNPDRWVFPNRPAGAVPTPTRIELPNGLKWKSISAGEAYANCGIAENDRAYCWGNHHIGSYLTTTSRVPVEVEFPSHIRLTTVHSGHSTACATTTDDELWCWGDAHYLGDGSIDPVRIPVRIPMPDNNAVENFTLGGGGTCAITSARNMYCWGNNGDGQLGLGYAQQFPYSYSWTPVHIPAPSGEQWATPSYAGTRLCALTVSGNGYCAGDNYEGSFGDGTYSDSLRFSKMVVPDNERLTSIATGWYHTCVGTESGKLWCFGRGGYGELGTGTTLGGRTWRTPVVPEGVRFTSFDAGVAGTCGLDTSGRVWCWGGLNWGSQGTGRINAGLSPELIAAVGSPSVFSTEATTIDAETATLAGTINPNGYASTAVIHVSTSQSFDTFSRHSISVTMSDNTYSPVPWRAALTDLVPRTVYYARVVATNTFGSVTGATTSFTTLGSEPTVSEIDIRDITGNEATLGVTLIANRLSSTAYFEWSTDQSFSTHVHRAEVEPFSGASSVRRVVILTDLTPNSTFYARTVATNRLGTTSGDVAMFRTVGGAPSISLVVISATSTRIDVTANIDTGLAKGTAHVELSTTSSFENVIQSDWQHFSSRGHGNMAFSIPNLRPRTDYWVRVIAANGVDATVSDTYRHRTKGGVPDARIISVSPDTTSATVSLVVDSTGLNTFSTLQISEHADLSAATEYFVSSSSADSAQYFSMSVPHLEPGTTYYAVIVAHNEAGQSVSQTSTFTTPRPTGVVINNNEDSTNSATVNLTVTAPSHVIAIRVSNHENFKNAKVFSPIESLSWELIASDEAEEVRTVYVQMYFSNGQSVVYQDSITLITDVDSPDDEAPIIQSLRVQRASVNARSAALTSKRNPRLTITLRDRRSGVTHIEAKTSTRTIVYRIDATRKGVHDLVLPRGISMAKVRVRDAAGNYSKWKSVRIR